MSPAISAKRSTRIARAAPSSASSAVATPLAASTYAAAACFGSRPGSVRRLSARGSRPRFARDLRLGAALRLVGEVEILEASLGVGRVDLQQQLVGELALFADAVRDGLAAVFELPQIAQALVQGSQLRIVEGAGGLLAVAGDEREPWRRRRGDRSRPGPAIPAR
jgi:hypothetical protein